MGAMLKKIVYEHRLLVQSQHTDSQQPSCAGSNFGRSFFNDVYIAPSTEVQLFKRDKALLTQKYPFYSLTRRPKMY